MGSHGLGRVCADDGTQRCYCSVVPGYVFDIASNKDTAFGVGPVYSSTDDRSPSVGTTERRQQDMIRNALMLRAEDIAVCVHFMLTQPPRTDVILMQVRPHRQEI